jgi:hypothetical protein
MKNERFAVLILSFGRADNLITLKTLRRQGYTGEVFIICSDDDKTLKDYKRNFGDSVIVFNKKEYRHKFDMYDNFENEKCVVYARNAAFEIAKNIGLKYFLVLDDDYTTFNYRVKGSEALLGRSCKNTDEVFKYFVSMLKNTPIKCIALAQGGDYIGGKDNGIYESITRKRKIMNSFFLDVDRPFKFNGRINEDVNAYVGNAKTGDIYMTNPLFYINQLETQSNSGGLTDIYLDSGTYVKSFYTIIANPSCVKLFMMGAIYRRIHHKINWKSAVPMIIHEKHRKHA